MKTPKGEWKSMTKAQKRRRKATNRLAKQGRPATTSKDSRGTGNGHLTRSSRPVVWDSAKGKGFRTKVKMSNDNLPSIAKAIAKETGWSESWVLGLNKGSILRLAAKYL